MEEGRSTKVFVKDIMSAVRRCVAKVKCMSMMRSKTDAIKARLMLTTLNVMSNKKKFSVGAISNKIHEAIDGVVSKRHKHGTNVEAYDEDYDDEKEQLALVLYEDAYKCANRAENEAVGLPADDEYDYKYPDLRHCLFDEEEAEELEDLLASGEDPNGNGESAIEIVKNSKENFNLEDDIDQVADLFITKFHKRMRLQKLLSFKRYQQMMERSSN